MTPEQIAKEIAEQNLPVFLKGTARDTELQAAIAEAIRQVTTALNETVSSNIDDNSSKSSCSDKFMKDMRLLADLDTPYVKLRHEQFETLVRAAKLIWPSPSECFEAAEKSTKASTRPDFQEAAKEFLAFVEGIDWLKARLGDEK